MSYGFPVINFCNPGVHYETPCISEKLRRPRKHPGIVEKLCFIAELESLKKIFCEQWLYAFAYDSLFCRDCACDAIGWKTFLLCCKIFRSRWYFTLHAYLALCQSSTSRAFVWSQSSYTGCSLLDVIYHLNLQYLLITDITAGIGRGGGGSGDSGCWLVSHLHDIETP